MDQSSDDFDSDIGSGDEMDDKQLGIHNMRKMIQPLTSYRYVHRLNGKLSSSKMKTDESYRTYFLKTYAGILDLADTSETMVDDSDIDDDDDDVVIETQSPQINSPIEQEHNLDDIREKTLEHDRQQIKGIQLANAGANNPKVINNYSVTSNACLLL
jgi:predicted small metal-binding protein